MTPPARSDTRSRTPAEPDDTALWGHATIASQTPGLFRPNTGPRRYKPAPSSRLTPLAQRRGIPSTPTESQATTDRFPAASRYWTAIAKVDQPGVRLTGMSRCATNGSQLPPDERSWPELQPPLPSFISVTGPCGLVASNVTCTVFESPTGPPTQHGLFLIFTEPVTGNAANRALAAAWAASGRLAIDTLGSSTLSARYEALAASSGR